MLPAPPRLPVLSVMISQTNYAEVSKWLIDHGRGRTGEYVCICNVHTVMEAHDDPAYAAVLNRAAIATPDGMPLVWSLRLLGSAKQTRVYGPDLVLAFAELCASLSRTQTETISESTSDHTGDAFASSNISSYFYGGAEGVAAELAQTLSERFPGFSFAGAESPPFRLLTPEEDDAMVARINASGADVVWVGLGAPKQELWMAAHAGRIRPVMVGVGAAFDFLTGRVPQAPRWMMAAGLEWLFRLVMEPRRLWRRYVYANPRFLFQVTRQLLFSHATPPPK